MSSLSRIRGVGSILTAMMICVAPASVTYGQATWNYLGQGLGPEARTGHVMCYDAARQQVVLFGGYGGSQLGDTWVWNGTSWVSKPALQAPSARYSSAMAYDPIRGEVVLFAGYTDQGYTNADTWVWDGSNWSLKSPATSPPATAEGGMVFDAARSEMVLVRSSTGFLDTWVWNGQNWTKRSAATSPPTRNYFGVTYDAARSEVVVFGGWDGSSVLHDTWVWNGTNWSDRTPTSSPPGLFGAKMIYEPALGRVLMFGGMQVWGGSCTPAFYEWDGSTWGAGSTVTLPGSRANHAMAYDSARGEVVMFGGYNCSIYLDEMWVYEVPPAILTHPVSQAVTSGQSATLNVVAGGTSPLAYQWYQGASGDTGSPIGGANSDHYTTPALTTNTNYWARVTNARGSANSNTAVITVTSGCVAPTVTTEPQSQTIASGQTAILSVAAYGTSPLTYQWYQGASGDFGSPIGGAISDQYTTPALTSSASYWAQLTNACGTASSATATITVAGAGGPTITSIKSKKRTPGSKATLAGSGFSTDKKKNTVYFGKYKADVTKAKSTKLTLKIPTKLKKGVTVGVYVNVNGAKSNTVQFTPK